MKKEHARVTDDAFHNHMQIKRGHFQRGQEPHCKPVQTSCTVSKYVPAFTNEPNQC